MKKLHLFFLFASIFLFKNAFSQNQPCNVHAGFTTTYVNNQLNAIQCVNTSTVDSAIVVYSVWNFGDGSPTVNTSGLSNPSHTYTASGLYNICVKVISVVPGTTIANCVDSICHQIQVQVNNPNPCNFAPNFTITSSPNTNNVFVFTNTSTPINTASVVTWNFGDSTSGTGHSATHTYNHSGTYQVCMHVAVSNTCAKDTCMTITVNIPAPTSCAVHAAFTTVYSNNQLNVVECINNSSAGSATAVYSVWNFGDGTPAIANPGLTNQTHTYTTSGLYTICLKIITSQVIGGVNCVDSICHQIQVQVNNPTSCNTQASFTWQINSGTSLSNNTVYFINTSTNINSTDSITWYFGDGTFSHDFNPIHMFPNFGFYSVCLKVKKNVAGSLPCVSDTCKTVGVNPTLASFPNPAQSTVNVNVVLNQPMPIYAFIYNLQGVLVSQIMQQGLAGNNLLTFNISGLPSGFYSIRIYTSTHVYFSRFQKL